MTDKSKASPMDFFQKTIAEPKPEMSEIDRLTDECGKIRCMIGYSFKLEDKTWSDPLREYLVRYLYHAEEQVEKYYGG